MKVKIKRTQKEMKLKEEYDKKNTFKCSCGHSVVIYPNKKKYLCTWCNHYVYRDKKDEFKDKVNELRKEQENE